MTAGTTPPRPREQFGPVPTLAIAVPLNLVLAVVGWVPWTATGALLVGIAGELGWADPHEDFWTGLYLLVLFIGVAGVLHLLVVIGANRALRRRSTLPARTYWAVVLPILSLPLLAIAVAVAYELS